MGSNLTLPERHNGHSHAAKCQTGQSHAPRCQDHISGGLHLPCRYGNPEFLREQAAKADAHLLATLPLLADCAAGEDGMVQSSGGVSFIVPMSSSSFRRRSRGSSATSAGELGQSLSQHQAAATAAARQMLGSGGHGLDLARYEQLLLKERRLAGGVLASSDAAVPSLNGSSGSASASGGDSRNASSGGAASSSAAHVLGRPHSMSAVASLGGGSYGGGEAAHAAASALKARSKSSVSLRPPS